MKSMKACLISCAALLVTLFGSTAYAQKGGTIIANTADNPVKVKAVDNPAHQRYSVAITLPQMASVPDGKIFVIEHVAGRLQIESIAGATGPCRVLYLAIAVGGEPMDVVPVYMGSAQGLTNEFNFFSFSQPIKSYAGPNSDIGATTSGLSANCKSFPIFHSRVILSGYLVDVAN